MVNIKGDYKQMDKQTGQKQYDQDLFVLVLKFEIIKYFCNKQTGKNLDVPQPM